jgi:exopolysaccharide biosynthesis polyprenyl glycosylphosphotransferase
MRRLDLTFTALLLPLDFLAVCAAGLTAYSLRTSQFFVELRPIFQEIPFLPYMAAVAVFALVWMALFMVAGLYSTRLRRAWNELGRIALACTAGVAIVIVTIFFRREWTASRFIVFALWPLTIVYLSAGRLILRAIRKRMLAAGYGHRRLVIIGQNKVAEDIATLYRTSPTLGYSVVRVFRSWSEATVQEMKKLVKKSEVDGILLADPSLSKDKALDIIAFSEEQHLSFHYLADLFAARFTHIEMSTAGGIPMIEVKRTPLDGWGRIAKRVFDLVFSSVILVIVSPLLLISAIIIVLQDGFPILFHNERVGERGNLFAVYKLRSMWKKSSIGPQFSQNANQENIEFEKKLIKEKSVREGPVYKIHGDPRITPFGHWIRRWSVDELPQFLNVLQGTMSIVGPRPHQPREVDGYEGHQRKVLAIKPGITGMAQISGRSDLDFADEVRLDTWYIENWSIWMDLYILLKTPLAVISHRKAE